MSISKFTYSNNTYYISKGSSSIKLEFHFQKIMNLRTKDIAYFEVINHLSYQSGEFNEQSDFFDDLDPQFIKKLALAQLRYVRRVKLPNPPSINVTLSCLDDRDFVNKLRNYSELEFALEIAIIDTKIDNDALKRNIKYLKQSGIKLWLDDFHLNSKHAIATLGEIGWDRIKVDNLVIKEFHSSPETISLFLFVLAPFVTDGIIFNGIETESEANAIFNFKAFAQGFYYQYPQNRASIHHSQNGTVNSTI